MATTTNYSWTTPDNTAYVKDGASAIRTLGSSVDTTLFTALGGAYPGLRLVKKQTIGSGVSSVTVTGAFSAAYENYRIVMNVADASVDSVSYNLKLGGSTGSTYSSAAKWVTYTSGAFGGTQNSASADGMLISLTGATNDTNCVIDLCNPFLAQRTTMSTQSANGTYMVYAGGVDTNAASSTSFTFVVSSGTLTGGTIYVYGYGAS
jgi:hypothetical protein